MTLKKVISKQTSPWNKRRIGNAENFINAAAFDRINSVHFITLIRCSIEATVLKLTF